MPINESGSDSFWMNDTVEVFRVCPEYGQQQSSEAVTVIGRNFRDSDVLICRFTACTGTSAGPRKCETLVPTSSEDSSIETAATYISGTRLQCPIPEYSFPSNESLLLQSGVCEKDNTGVLAYVQSCEIDAISDGSCQDDAGDGYRFVYDTLVRTCRQLRRGQSPEHVKCLQAMLRSSQNRIRIRSACEKTVDCASQWMAIYIE